jgi:hypothetical protein
LNTVKLIFTKLVPLGAVVLAHSLRDNGTKAKLVALYTPDTLQYATIKELQVWPYYLTLYFRRAPVFEQSRVFHHSYAADQVFLDGIRRDHTRTNSNESHSGKSMADGSSGSDRNIHQD